MGLFQILSLQDAKAPGSLALISEAAQLNYRQLHAHALRRTSVQVQAAVRLSTTVVLGVYLLPWLPETDLRRASVCDAISLQIIDTPDATLSALQPTLDL